MAYVTAVEYTTITGEAAPADFSALCDIADSIIDTYTLYGLIGRALTGMPLFIQTNIKKAAAMQIQYLDQRGGLSALNDAGYASASLGKFSYSQPAGSSVALASPLVDTFLQIVSAYLRGVS